MENIKIQEIELINATIDDYDFYYALKSEKSNIYWSGHKRKPDQKKFRSWYRINVLNSDICFKIILCKGKKVGVIYFKLIDQLKCNYLGLGISEKYQGKGIASVVVLKFIENLKINFPNCLKIIFFIRADNLNSQKIHLKLGCTKTGEYEDQYLKSNKTEVTLEEWELIL